MNKTAADFQWEGLFHSPDMYLLEFTEQQALFIRMTRESYYRSIFTDRQRIIPVDPKGRGINLDRLLDRSDLESVQQPLRFIFHLAHGGSTLLARALDSPGHSLVIREPSPLRQLAVERLATHPMLFNQEHWMRRLRLVTGLLGRRYQESEPVLVKANVPVNFILPEVLSLHEDSCGLMLYSGLTQYLVAVLKSPAHQRWVVNVIRQLAGGVKQIPALSSVMVEKLSPPEAAACLWISQMVQFVRALDVFPNLRSLQSETFFDQPADTLKAATGFMGIVISDDDVNRMVAGELFSMHAKNPGQVYDNAARKNEYRRQLADNQLLISEGVEWAEGYLSALDIPEVLPRPLIV
jgi:hypothetical protein